MSDLTPEDREHLDHVLDRLNEAVGGTVQDAHMVAVIKPGGVVQSPYADVVKAIDSLRKDVCREIKDLRKTIEGKR